MQELWTTLGADPFAAAEIVELRLPCSDGFLNVRGDANGSEPILQRVMLILLTLWRFKKYSDSRWVSVLMQLQDLNARLANGP